jgi:hypothetical protein
MALAVLLCSFCLEAAEVGFLIEDRGQSIGQTALVNDRMIYVAGTGGDPSSDLLFDASRQILYLIEHDDRSYLQIDNQTIDEVAALVDSVSGVVESQQGVVSDLLSTFGISNTPEEPIAELRDSGRQLAIGGFSCQLHQAHRNDKLQFEICVTDNQQLKLNQEDYSTLKEFLVFSNRMQNKAGKLLTTLGIILPKMDLASSKGLPIGLYSPGQGLKVRVTGIDSASKSTQLTVPAGYIRSSIPLVSG